MFKKREQNFDSFTVSDDTYQVAQEPEDQTSNTILKGSKLIGDINITCDLELSGEIEGNIISDSDSNIVIKGACNGNIETKEGTVTIEGDMLNGNINAGSDVTISGKFAGGTIKSKGKISIYGEFKGTLEGQEIELGSKARGAGELHYREHISIARGAKIEGHIKQMQQELKLLKSEPETKKEPRHSPAKEISNA